MTVSRLQRPSKSHHTDFQICFVPPRSWALLNLGPHVTDLHSRLGVSYPLFLRLLPTPTEPGYLLMQWEPQLHLIFLAYGAKSCDIRLDVEYIDQDMSSVDVFCSPKIKQYSTQCFPGFKRSTFNVNIHMRHVDSSQPMICPAIP